MDEVSGDLDVARGRPMSALHVHHKVAIEWLEKTRDYGQRCRRDGGQNTNNHLSNEDLVVVRIRQSGLLETQHHNPLKIRITGVQKIHHLNDLGIHSANSEKLSGDNRRGGA